VTSRQRSRSRWWLEALRVSVDACGGRRAAAGTSAAARVGTRQHCPRL